MIQRRVHQIWIGPEIPQEIQGYCDDMKRMNSDMEYQLHRNEVLERYKDDPYVRYLLNAEEKMAFVVDRIRVLLLRDEGGIYIDADARPVRPFSTLPWLDMPHVDFAFACRDAYRPGVAIARGISFIDNTFLASRKNGRMANRLCALYHSKAPKRDGGAIGREIFSNLDWTCVALNFRYVYAMERYPETLVLHDPFNLGSWVTKTKPALIMR